MFVMDGDKSVATYANNPVTYSFDRIDNIPRYRVIDCEAFKLKAKDEYQVCAFYALKNADNVLITGKWGSGKSLISTAYALANNSRKTFISRPPVGIDRKYDIGFLPGSTFDKLNSWAMGFLSSLYFLFGNTKNQEKDNKTFDYVKSELFKKYFELIDINSLPAPSVLKNLDYETILQENTQYFKNLLPTWQPLESDEFLIVLQAFSYRELFLRNEFNKSLFWFF